MMRNILLILGAVAILAVGGLAWYQWQGGPASKPAAAPAAENGASGADRAKALEISADDLVLGAADAPVTVIEYASLTCPHCRDFHENVLPQVKSAYIDTGKVRFVLRDFPLDQGALAAAMVARCAGPERRKAFLDLLFQRQEAWAHAQDVLAGIARTAGFAGMDTETVQACFKQEATQRAVLEQRLLGERAFDISATPTFIINGTKHSGGMTFDQFKAMVDPLIAEAGK